MSFQHENFLASSHARPNGSAGRVKKRIIIMCVVLGSNPTSGNNITVIYLAVEKFYPAIIGHHLCNIAGLLPVRNLERHTKVYASFREYQALPRIIIMRTRKNQLSKVLPVVGFGAASL